jgi:hypothetical protein
MLDNDNHSHLLKSIKHPGGDVKEDGIPSRLFESQFFARGLRRLAPQATYEQQTFEKPCIPWPIRSYVSLENVIG